MEKNIAITNNIEKKADPGIDLKVAISKILRHWYWFVIGLALALFMVKIYIRYSVPVYEVSSKILMKAAPPTSNIIASNLLSQSNMAMGNEIQRLSTTYLMRKVVKDLQLNASVFSKGRVKTNEYYGNDCPFVFNIISNNDSIGYQSFLFSIPSATSSQFHLNGGAINGSYSFGDTIKSNNLTFTLQKGKNYTPPYDNLIISFSPVEAIARGLVGGLSIEPTGSLNASALKLSYTTTIPQKGEDILNSLYSNYAKTDINDKNAIADSTIKFINNQIDILRSNLGHVESDVENYKASNRVPTTVGAKAGMVISKSTELENKLFEQKIENNVFNLVAEYINNNPNRIVPTTLTVNDPNLKSAVENYNSLILEKEKILQYSKEANPVVQDINAQIQRSRNVLITTVNAIKQGMNLSNKDYQNKSSQVEQEVSNIPSLDRGYQNVAREQIITEQLYTYLLQKRAETEIAKSGTTSNSELLESATTQGMIKPKKSVLYIIAILLGLIIPALLLFIKELFNNKIIDKKDLTSLTQVPIVGELGHNTTEQNIVVTNGARSILSEQFRSLRSNLQFILQGKNNQALLVTSSMSGEGKSFISSNIATSIAISGKKVVLMELDLRKPKISARFGMENDSGYTNYMISDISESSIIKKTDISENLFLISSGSIPPNPVEMLMTDKTKKLFEYLKQHFDYIVIDTAPIGLVTDALVIGELVNACLYVVRQKYTLKDQMAIINELANNKKLPNLGIIINDIDTKSSYGYGYGYGYAYGNGYYAEDNNKKNLLKPFSRIKR